MPNTKTAIKNLRKTERQTAINKNKYSQLKTVVKKIISAKVQGLSDKIHYDEFEQNTRDLFAKMHSLSKDHSHLKLRASRFESRVKQAIKKIA